MSELNAQLILAAKKGDQSLCATLLARGADANAINEYHLPVLLAAIVQGRAPICLMLLEHGANPCILKNGSPLLHWAVGLGRANLCAMLLEYKSDPLFKDEKGHTALDKAIAMDKKECAGIIQSWMTANAARAALQEITADTSLKAVAP